MPPTQLLEELTASRFVASIAKASVGVGERQSASLGSGMVFAEHRPYQPGDDTRHLDARLLARLGEPFIRLYSVDRQLPITILVDASPSMDYGKPHKFQFALLLAQVLGFIGLKGGDQVQVGLLRSGTVYWSSRYSSGNQIDMLFDWVGGQQLGTPGKYGDGVRAALGRIKRGGLVFLISDWWDDGLEIPLDGLAETRSEVVAIHVAAPEEMDPASAGAGPHTLIDSESGQEISVVLDDISKANYAKAFTEWSEALRSGLSQRQARYILASSSTAPRDFFLKNMRIAGLVM